MRLDKYLKFPDLSKDVQLQRMLVQETELLLTEKMQSLHMM